MGKWTEAALRQREVMDRAAALLDDEQAATVPTLYRAWKANTVYAEGDRRHHKGVLYKCRQGHTSQAAWTPDVLPALWAVIDETHAGTVGDPIHYRPGMELEEGKYYSEAGVVYYCWRSTGAAVYASLSELVDIYVKIAEV